MTSQTIVAFNLTSQQANAVLPKLERRFELSNRFKVETGMLGFKIVATEVAVNGQPAQMTSRRARQLNHYVMGVLDALSGE